MILLVEDDISLNETIKEFLDILELVLLEKEHIF